METTELLSRIKYSYKIDNNYHNKNTYYHTEFYHAGESSEYKMNGILKI